MKTLSRVTAMFGICTAILAWLHILYRLQLFVAEYNWQRGLNHVGDGIFFFAYIFHGFFAVALALAAWVFWKDPSRWRHVACWAAAAHLATILMLITMHSTGVLVEYSEYIRNVRNRASTPNYPAAGNAGIALCLRIERLGPGVPEPACSA